jgi:hypothetical protein
MRVISQRKREDKNIEEEPNIVPKRVIQILFFSRIHKFPLICNGSIKIEKSGPKKSILDVMEKSH